MTGRKKGRLLGDVINKLRLEHSNKGRKKGENRTDPTSETTKLRKRAEIFERAQLLSNDHFKAQIIVFIHFPNTKQSTTYGRAYGNVAQSFLDTHKTFEKMFFETCNAADQGVIVANPGDTGTPAIPSLTDGPNIVLFEHVDGQGVDVSSQNIDGMNTQAIQIHNNSEDSNLEFFVTAADKGIDVSSQNSDGMTTQAIHNNSENSKVEFFVTAANQDEDVIIQNPDGTNTLDVSYLIHNESRDKKDESVAPSLTQASTSQPTSALIPPPNLDSVVVIPSATDDPFTIPFPTAPYPFLIESRDGKDKSVTPSLTQGSAPQPTLALIPPPDLESVFVVPSDTEDPPTIPFPPAPSVTAITSTSCVKKRKNSFSIEPSRTATTKKNINAGRVTAHIGIPRRTAREGPKKKNEIEAINAKEKCQARVCKLPKGQQTWVQCEGVCENWFHIRCLGLKVGDLKDSAPYICADCQTNGRISM